MLSELYLKRVFVEGELIDEDHKFYQQELRAFELVYCYPAVILLTLSQITPDLSLLHLAVIGLPGYICFIAAIKPMKTVFDKKTRDELISRIRTLDENSTAQWGKMSVYQMLKHCTMFEDMITGKTIYKRAFIGRLFGKIALKAFMKNDSPIRRSTPTIPELRITGNGDVEVAKAKWIAQMEDHAHFSNPDLVHPFFGKMAEEQIGYMAYKHTDHHLRQFNS